MQTAALKYIADNLARLFRSKIYKYITGSSLVVQSKQTDSNRTQLSSRLWSVEVQDKLKAGVTDLRAGGSEFIHF